MVFIDVLSSTRVAVLGVTWRFAIGWLFSSLLQFGVTEEALVFVERMLVTEQSLLVLGLWVANPAAVFVAVMLIAP